jgi:hypothetical protein
MKITNISKAIRLSFSGRRPRINQMVVLRILSDPIAMEMIQSAAMIAHSREVSKSGDPSDITDVTNTIDIIMKELLREQ